MTTAKKLSGLALATAAAGLFAVAPIAANAAGEAGTEIHCYGANSCKGQSACKTANNACSGQNACKGQGFVAAASEEECTNAGGRLEE